MKPSNRYMISLMLLLVVTIPAVASHFRDSPRTLRRETAMPMQGLVHRLHRLDLSPEQEQRTSKILHETLPALLDLRLSMHDVSRQIRHLAREKTLDVQRLDELATQRGELSKQITIRRTTAIAGLIGVLTDRQRERLLASPRFRRATG